MFEGFSGDGLWEPHAAYGCALAGDAEVQDAEMVAVVLFLSRCVRTTERDAKQVHAIIAIDSRSCFDEIEAAWRDESTDPLVGRNRAAILETICHLRRRVGARGGTVRLIWVPAHVGIYSNQMVDAVAKAFLYDTPCEPQFIVRRSLAVHEVITRPELRGAMVGGASALLADRKFFRLMRRLGMHEELRRLRSADTAWLGRWPLLDYEQLGEVRPGADAPRWTALVRATSSGGAPGNERKLSTTGASQLLRSGGKLLFDRLCCPLCGWQPHDGIIDMRHVLCGECGEGATSDERREVATQMRGVLDVLPGARTEVARPDDEHACALAQEVEMAACTMESGMRRDEAGAETWWCVARALSGMLPQMGRCTAAAIVDGIEDEKKREQERDKARGQVLKCLDGAARVMATVLERWLTAQTDQDACEPKARRQSFSGEQDEVIRCGLEHGRGERHERRESVGEQRRAAEAHRVQSNQRPLRVRLALGPVAIERLRRPRWWREAEEQRRQRLRQAEAQRRQQQRHEELMRRRDAQQLEAARAAAMAMAQQMEAAAAEAEAAAAAARAEARMQAEMEALMAEVADPEAAAEAVQEGGQGDVLSGETASARRARLGLTQKKKRTGRGGSSQAASHDYRGRQRAMIDAVEGPACSPT